METLADLEKEVEAGKTPEGVVGRIAGRTPTRSGLPSLHHGALAAGELLGHSIAQLRVPYIGGGNRVKANNQRGMILSEMPELEAFQRWQDGEFLQVERLFARVWRAGLSDFDLDTVYRYFRPPAGVRLRSLDAAKRTAEQLLRRDGSRYATLRLALQVLGVPRQLWPRILQRWRAAGGPHLVDFAPYTAHVLTVEVFFNFAIGSDLISRERPSNKIDIAYLYYLPFCMVFVSHDKLHARTAPCFLAPDQIFVHGTDFKRDLAAIDAHYAALPEEVRQRGVMEFAFYPPDGDFLVTRLWDRFLSGWRKKRDRKQPASSEREKRRLAEHLRRMHDESELDAPSVVETDQPDFVTFRRLVPRTMGKWRLLPPDI